MTALDTTQLELKVKDMYRQVAHNPHGVFHFEMGQGIAERLGYPAEQLDRVPGAALESFAGVGYFFDLADLRPGDRVIDLGSGSGTDAFLAAALVGPSGRVVGVDFTPEQVEKARALAAEAGIGNIEFLEGRIEELPVEDGWADVVIANGVLNLVADKPRAFAEAHRALRPGGVLQFADIAVGREVPHAARCDIELWTDCIAGGLSIDEWTDAIAAAGFIDIAVGMPTDSFGGAAGETRAREYAVTGHTFRAVAT